MKPGDKIRLRSQDFLARTGDRLSIAQLLESIGDANEDISQYALDKVFKNPKAYAELMDPDSRTRLKVIHRFSENDPERAVKFSLASLAQHDDNLSLLSLDVLDCNIAYLEPGIELTLERLLHRPSERIQVKAARLLILLSHYFDFAYDQDRVVQIIEKALDSKDLYCRQMAYGMPASVFYKIKQVKSTIAQLKSELTASQQRAEDLENELSETRFMFQARQQQERSYAQIVENVEAANARLREQMALYEKTLIQREREIQLLREGKSEESEARHAVLQSLIQERKARAHEVEHARRLYEELVADYHARESDFKHQAHDFYHKFKGIFKTLIEEKEALLSQLDALHQNAPEA